MKPRLFDRILLVLFMLLIMALGAAIVAVGINVIPKEALEGIIALPYYYFLINKIATVAIGALLFIIALRLIIGMNRTAPSQKPLPTVTITTGELGSSSIAISAIEDMVQRHCAANPELKEHYSAVSTAPEGKLKIDLKLALNDEANVPAVTEALRESLKSYIEGLTGVAVGDISIMVVTAKPAAEAK